MTLNIFQTIMNTSESLSSTGINDEHNNVSDNNCNNQLSNNLQDEGCEVNIKY